MNHHTSRRPTGLSSFTLVELLVVMGIIAILASTILYAGGLAIRAAKRARAANMATQIQTGVLNYYTEYSVYPVPSSTTTDYYVDDTSASASKWQSLLYCLCGNINPATGLASSPPSTIITNSRGIAFLSLKTSDVDGNNAPVNPLPTGSEIYFNIAMDSDYDGILGTTSPTSTVMPNFGAGTATSLPTTGGTTTAGVAVWANCCNSTKVTNANFWIHTY